MNFRYQIIKTGLQNVKFPCALALKHTNKLRIVYQICKNSTIRLIDLEIIENKFHWRLSQIYKKVVRGCPYMTLHLFCIFGPPTPLPSSHVAYPLTLFCFPWRQKIILYGNDWKSIGHIFHAFIWNGYCT